MKTNKKIILIISCLSFCLTIFIISDTYAKYLTSAIGSSRIPVARWNIKINNQTIRDNSDFSSTLAPIFPGNSNIASNIIAPTAEGYMDLNFDFSGADVSFSYSITVQPNANSSVRDLVVTGYSINGGNIVPVNSSQIISETIHYSDNIQGKTFRIYIKWKDDNTATMNNIEDTLATNSSRDALMDVNVSFTQVAEDNNNLLQNQTQP